MKSFFWSALFLFISTSAQAFTLISNAGHLAKWPSSPNYEFHTNTSGYFPGGVDHSGTSTDEFTPIITAFSTWTGLGGISVNRLSDTATTPTSSDSHNTVMWIQTAWRSLSFQPPSNALAVTLLAFNSSTGAIVNADIYFNAQYFQWAKVDDVSESSYIDVQNIATHEIGHFFGLDHSSESLSESDATLSDATMFYASGGGETKRRDLNSDDTAAFSNLYGSGAATPTITSVERTSVSDTENVFTVRGSNFGSSTEFILTQNRTSVSDSVSRYHTLVSATEASVRFDVESFPSGEASLVVFNSPTASASMQTEVAGGLYASSTGGGGGCEISLSDQGFAIAWMILSGMLFLALFSYRFSRAKASSKDINRIL